MKVFLLFLALLPCGLFAQCERAAEVAQIIALAQQDLNVRHYERAINRLLDVRDICPENKPQVNLMIEQTFQQIEGEKQSALRARRQAEQQQARANWETERADSSLNVANQVLEQMYFYKERFGLTLKNVSKNAQEPKYHYGYIDRQGKEVIPFVFEEATPFSVRDGYARVQKEQQKYLLDTAGVIYRLAESLEELEVETEALDLHENLPDSLPDNIGEYQALKIILCYGSYSGKGPLQSLPASFTLLKNLKHLDLSRNDLNSLPESFGQLSQLQSLDLSSNKLESLLTSFAQLSQLNNLDLSGNRLSSLPESFRQLSKLQSLKIYSNKLESLPTSFAQLSQLKSLDLNINRLSSLPESFVQLSQLKSLNLGNNRLSNLPEVLTQLSQLKSLDLSGNGLSNILESFGQLSQLISLNLSDNSLNHLPEVLTQLSQLESLNLSENGLSSLPKSFGRLSQLKSLYLGNNSLSSLPESFGQLSQLKSLDLSNNDLSSFPESFRQLSQLQILSLRYNQLSSLPDIICDMENLKIRGYSFDPFTIEGNPLTELPDCWLDKHTERELINFAQICLNESLYHVAWQTLDNLQRRFPESFATEKAGLYEIVANLEGEDGDLLKIKKMLGP